MTRWGLLGLQDVRNAYRLISECRDLGSDPALWHLKMAEELCGLIGAPMVSVGEGLWVRPGPRPATLELRRGFRPEASVLRRARTVPPGPRDREPEYPAWLQAGQRCHARLVPVPVQVLHRRRARFGFPRPLGGARDHPWRLFGRTRAGEDAVAQLGRRCGERRGRRQQPRDRRKSTDLVRARRAAPRQVGLEILGLRRRQVAERVQRSLLSQGIGGFAVFHRQRTRASPVLGLAGRSAIIPKRTIEAGRPHAPVDPLVG